MLMKRNSLLKFLTTAWSNVNFQTQLKTNCKVCRIMRRVSVFFVVVHSFGQRGETNQFLTKVVHFCWSWAVIVENFHQWLGSLVAVRNKLLLMRSFLKDWFFGLASGCFWMILTKPYRLYMDNLSIFGNRNNELHIWKVFFFLDIQFKFHHFLDFQNHSLRNGNKQSDCSRYVTSVLSWKRIYISYIRFCLNLFCKDCKFVIFCAFMKSMISMQVFSVKIRFWIKLFLARSDFEVKFSQRFRFWNKNVTTCQKLNQFFEQASDFEPKILQGVRFWVYLLCILPRVYTFIKIVHVPVLF